MKHFCIISIVCFLMNAGLQAQEEYIQPRKHLLDGIEQHDKGEFSKALKAYNKINRNDSLYPLALYEKSLSYNALEEYDKAIEVLNELLSKSDSTSQILISLASAYDDKKNHAEAQAIYKKVIDRQPYNQNAWYNLGLSYYNDKQYLKAEECFVQSIKLKPWHFRSNLILGLTNAKMGRPVHALACINLAALMNAGDNFGHSALQEYEKFVHGDYEADIEYDKYVTPDSITTDKIRALEPIIKSQVLQSKKLKMPSKNPMTITKYNYVIFSELPQTKEKNNIYTAYYFPFLRSILDNKYFDVYSYFITQSVNNKNIIKYVLTKKSKLNAFSGWMIKELQKYFASPFFRPSNVDYAYAEGNLIRITTYSDSTKTVKDGKYIELDENGDLEYTGTFKNDKHEGTFNSYSVDGKVRVFVKYKNDDEYLLVSNPEVIKGNQFEVEMKDGKKNGWYKTFFPNGAVKSIELYKDDEFVGDGFELYIDGDTMTTYKPDADGLHYTTTNYYRNGKISTCYKRLIDSYLYDGEYISNFYNGKLARKITLKDDLFIGKTFTLFLNGDTAAIQKYDDKGNATGIHSSFGTSGKLISSIEYQKGKSNYIFTYYHRNGKPQSQLKVSNNKFNTLVYYDSTGKEIVHHDNLNRNLNEYTNVNVFTKKIIDHFVLKDGLRDGPAKHYTHSGTLESECKYSKDEIDGVNVTYYPDGAKRSEYTYEEGVLKGKAISYYSDGKIESEGFYDDDNKVGEWRYFHADGKLSNTEYYNTSGELNGEQIEYCGDSIPVSVFTYREGNIIDLVFYGPDMDTLEHYSLPNGFGKNTIYYKNGKLKTTRNYEHHVLHDSVVYYYPNGQLYYKINYVNGFRHGRYCEFNPDGSKKRELDFEYGQRCNENNFYLENGFPDASLICKNNEENGPATYYHYNGKPTAIINFSNDEKNGFADYYEPGGQLMYRVWYESNEAVSITWLGKDKRFLEPVLIDKDTIKVTTYYASGSKSAELSFVGGMRHGEFRGYFPNGKLLEIRPFKNNYLDGKEICYRDNGILFAETEYLIGDKHGVCTVYHPNGKPAVRTEYYFGERKGTQTYYNDKGQVKNEYQFYGDRMLE